MVTRILTEDFKSLRRENLPNIFDDPVIPIDAIGSETKPRWLENVKLIEEKLLELQYDLKVLGEKMDEPPSVRDDSKK